MDKAKYAKLTDVVNAVEPYINRVKEQMVKYQNDEWINKVVVTAPWNKEPEDLIVPVEENIICEQYKDIAVPKYIQPLKICKSGEMSEQELRKQLANLQYKLDIITAPKFTDEEAADIKSIVEKLKGMGAFLGGSREKLNDLDYTSKRDWDFHLPVQEEQYDWEKFDAIYTDIGKYINQNFTRQYNDEAEMYKDHFFDSYYKNDLYPHITVIYNKDFTKYKKMWTKLDKQYWHDYIWKSNPAHKVELSNPEALRAFKQRNRDFFNAVSKMVEVDLGDFM